MNWFFLQNGFALRTGFALKNASLKNGKFFEFSLRRACKLKMGDIE
jgi:hypothetical protein